MRYTTLVTALIISLIFSACSADDGPAIEEVRGRVLLGTAANGLEDCEWLIVIDGQNYVPNTLVNQFRVDGLEVFMQVEFLNVSANCGTLATSPERLRIEQIREAE